MRSLRSPLHSATRAGLRPFFEPRRGGAIEPPDGLGGVILFAGSGTAASVYPADPTAGLGASIGAFDVSADSSQVALFQSRLAALPGLALLPLYNPAASTGINVYAAPPASFTLSGGPFVVPSTESDPSIAATSSLVFGLSLILASDVGDYTLRAAQMVGAQLTQVGNTLTGSFGHDTSAGVGSTFSDNIRVAAVIDGHFCTTVPDTSGGRSTGLSVYAFSFDGADFTLEDSLDLSATSWNHRSRGNNYLVFGNSAVNAGSSNGFLRFVGYSAAGGFTSFDVNIADLMGVADVMNNYVVDPVTGRIHLGISDTGYTTFSTKVLVPNFGTNSLDTVATIGIDGADEDLMYPTAVCNDLLAIDAAFAGETGLVRFDGSGYARVGAPAPVDPYAAHMLLIP
jgi:hypothetical protein